MGIFGSFNNKRSDISDELRRGSIHSQQTAPQGKWQAGDKILDRFEIRDIKYGGMGTVYIAFDTLVMGLDRLTGFNTMYAIKTFQDKYLWNQDAIDRFTTEAQTWVDLERHENIVFANFVFNIEGKPYIFLECLNGGDLSNYVGKLNIPQSIKCAIEICNGMDYAYKKLGIIHRDLKPANIIANTGAYTFKARENLQPGSITSYDSSENFSILQYLDNNSALASSTSNIWKVTDFGLVRAVQQEAIEADESLSDVVSRGMGTWPYMPPEQFSETTQREYNFSPREITTRSDIYSFGATMYQVITARLPFNSIEEIFTKKTPIIRAELERSVPERFGSVISRCLEKKPQDRYESFGELLEELFRVYDVYPLEFIAKDGRVYRKDAVYHGPGELRDIDWANRGISFEQLGKYDQALTCYDKALALNKNISYAWQGRGNCYVNLTNYQEARTSYDKAIKADKSQPGGWYGKGLALAKLGKTEKALECYQKAIELDQVLVLNWAGTGMGITYSELGGAEKAVSIYNRVLKKHPGNTLTWTLKSQALHQLEKVDSAIECLDKALAVNPDDTFALINKGVILEETGKYREAIALYDRAISVAPRYYLSWNNKGLCLTSHFENYEEAIFCLNRVIDIRPKYYPAWYTKGYCLDKIGEQNEAVAVFNRFLDIAPTDYSFVKFARDYVRQHKPEH